MADYVSKRRFCDFEDGENIDRFNQTKKHRRLSAPCQPIHADLQRAPIFSGNSHSQGALPHHMLATSVPLLPFPTLCPSKLDKEAASGPRSISSIEQSQPIGGVQGQSESEQVRGVNDDSTQMWDPRVDTELGNLKMDGTTSEVYYLGRVPLQTEGISMKLGPAISPPRSPVPYPEFVYDWLVDDDFGEKVCLAHSRSLLRSAYRRRKYGAAIADTWKRGSTPPEYREKFKKDYAAGLKDYDDVSSSDFDEYEEEEETQPSTPHESQHYKPPCSIISST